MYRGKVTAVDASGVYVQTAEYGTLGPCQAVVANYYVDSMVLCVNVGDEASPELVVVGQLSAAGSAAGISDWVDYTPTLTASTTNPTNWTQDARWTRIGDVGIVRFRLMAGASMTAGSGTYRIALPANGNTSPVAGVGTALIYDASTGATRLGELRVADTAYLTIGYPATWGGALATVTHAAPWTWAADDQIRGTFTYEIV
jgi:hypothetical protein